MKRGSLFDIIPLEHHIEIMHGAELLTIDAVLSEGIQIGGLNWGGHDFVDTIRDETTWRRTMAAAEKAGGAGFAFIMDPAKFFAQEELRKVGSPLV